MWFLSTIRKVRFRSRSNFLEFDFLPFSLSVPIMRSCELTPFLFVPSNRIPTPFSIDATPQATEVLPVPSFNMCASELHVFPSCMSRFVTTCEWIVSHARLLRTVLRCFLVATLSGIQTDSDGRSMWLRCRIVQNSLKFPSILLVF